MAVFINEQRNRMRITNIRVRNVVENPITDIPDDRLFEKQILLEILFNRFVYSDSGSSIACLHI